MKVSPATIYCYCHNLKSISSQNIDSPQINMIEGHALGLLKFIIKRRWIAWWNGKCLLTIFRWINKPRSMVWRVVKRRVFAGIIFEYGFHKVSMPIPYTGFPPNQQLPFHKPFHTFHSIFKQSLKKAQGTCTWPLRASMSFLMIKTGSVGLIWGVSSIVGKPHHCWS